MRTELTAANLAEFRERFGTFHDAVIHSFHYDIFSRAEVEKIQITVGTIDLAVQETRRWINLTFEIEGITRIILHKPEKHLCGIVHTLIIGIFDNEVYMNFFPFSRNADDSDNYVEKIRKGPSLVVVGKKCFWSVSPYQECGWVNDTSGQTDKS